MILDKEREKLHRLNMKVQIEIEKALHKKREGDRMRKRMQEMRGK